MAAAHRSRLQKMLQAAVQSVQWTYSLFWQICPQQGMLLWSDGYYNGATKTRKTVQPMESAPRPCTELSPEELTESELFYLMCVSFSFTPGVGLPGKAYVRRQHIWLTGANEVDSKAFSRAILAKTVLCIPLLDGVLELGSTEKTRFHSPSVPPLCSAADALLNATQENDHNADDDDEEDEDEEPESYSAETGRNILQVSTQNIQAVAAAVADGPSELMQLEMSEDIKLGSPDDASNNLDSDFHMLAVSQSGNHTDHQLQGESSRRWQMLQEPSCSSLQPPSTGNQPAGWIHRQPATPRPTLPPFGCRRRHFPVAPEVHSIHRTIPAHQIPRRELPQVKRLRRSLRRPVPQGDPLGGAQRQPRDTIEYVKQLRKKIQELETLNREMEADNERSRLADSVPVNQRSGVTTRSMGPDKRKMRVLDGGAKLKTVETSVEVSIIESDALLELQCGYREGLFLYIMHMLREKLQIVITAVQSSLSNGLFVAELRAKLKDNLNGKKVSIMEVKRAINQVIPQFYFKF
ncbi:Transcription factor TT8 [Hibiscus syriacus]|uniref:Transcription factor TT8 n=1 Tax=Hibiscus syriacus TaxID=106335 RepID=A0A6A3CQM4_HIBSY|nr:Transcription factor TT8 [Hibiscus syriacus]